MHRSNASTGNSAKMTLYTFFYLFKTIPHQRKNVGFAFFSWRVHTNHVLSFYLEVHNPKRGEHNIHNIYIMDLNIKLKIAEWKHLWFWFSQLSVFFLDSCMLRYDYKIIMLWLRFSRKCHLTILKLLCSFCVYLI